MDNQKLIQYSNNSVLQNYCKEYNISIDLAEIHFNELKKFLAKCAVESDIEHIPSNVIDNIWHVFILHTADYKDFCEKIIGKFIHHRPRVAASGGDNASAECGGFGGAST